MNIYKIQLLFLKIFYVVIFFNINIVPQTALRFAAIGDFGDAGSDEQNVANLVKSWNVDFIITLGDNNYPEGKTSTIDENIGQYYHQYIYPYVGSYGEGSDVNRFFPSLGNHDWRTNPPQPHYDYFELFNNERYYDFVWGNTHFFAIDSDSDEPDGVSPGSVQGQWLKNALASSSAKWRVVYFHHCPYSSSSKHGSQEYMQWPFKEWGASVVFAGHDHVYERVIVDDLLYFVNGLGGRSKYAFGKPIRGSEVRYNDDYGAMLIEACEDSIIFKFITVTEEVIDSYTLYSINPLDLGSFRGKAVDSNVHLNWISITELNNYGFEILRRSTSLNPLPGREQKEWIKIAFLPGHDTTADQQTYSYIDESVPSGKYQYRLKQIDFQGKFEYSNIVEVEVGIPSKLSLGQNYPDPFNTATKIKYTIPANVNKETSNVSLINYDVLGNKIATLVNEDKPAGMYEVEWDASGLPSGIYFYQLKVGIYTETKKMLLLK